MKLTQTIENTAAQTDIVSNLKLEVEHLEEKLTSFDDQIELLSITNDKCRIVNEFISLRKQVSIFVDEKQNTEIQYNDRKKQFDELEKDWLNNQAAAIAASLHRWGSLSGMWKYGPSGQIK